MNIQEAKKIIAIAKEADDTVIMQGKHGIGKSAIVREYCNDNHYYLTELFLSNQEVGDLIGRPETIDMVQYWSVPNWLQKMYDANAEGKECILHLDEFNRADPDVLQAALQLILEGKIHEHELPKLNGKRTHIIASINPPNSLYDVNELDPALLDRFLFINVEPCLKTFIQIGKSHNIHESIINFLIANPKFLHWEPKDSNEVGATPRSWDKLSNYIHLHDKKDLGDLGDSILDIIMGKVGKIPGMEFYVFMNSSSVKLSDIIEVINKNKDLYDDIQELANSIPRLDSPIQRTNAVHQIKDPFTLLVYLYSVEQEILISSLKDLRNTDIFNELVKIDDALNNKELFKKATSASI